MRRKRRLRPHKGKRQERFRFDEFGDVVPQAGDLEAARVELPGVADDATGSAVVLALAREFARRRWSARTDGVPRNAVRVTDRR